MRRTLSNWLVLFLVLGLGMGPGAEAALVSLSLDSSVSAAEARLPACCRKHGVHHCVMSSQPAGSETTLSAPNLCPYWPHSIASNAAPTAAVAASSRKAISGKPQRLRIIASRQSLESSTNRDWPKRGPPTPSIL